MILASSASIAQSFGVDLWENQTTVIEVYPWYQLQCVRKISLKVSIRTPIFSTANLLTHVFKEINMYTGEETETGRGQPSIQQSLKHQVMKTAPVGSSV